MHRLQWRGFKKFLTVSSTPSTQNVPPQGIKHAKKRIDALQKELSLANNGPYVMAPAAEEEEQPPKAAQ